MMSKKHEEILAIQQRQLEQKEIELRFIAENVEALVEAMWAKGRESRIGYEDEDAYSLWRGSSIDWDLRRTNSQGTVYHIVEAQVDLEKCIAKRAGA